MLSSGAYSKQYQQVEKYMKEDSKKARKAAKARTHVLLRQTAQRQKALEERKKAMAIAEDQRRRKALEDRRREQKEATERFRSAISRLRTTTKAQNPSLKRVAEMHVEYYLPRKAKPPTSRTGSHSSSSAGRDSRTHEGRRERVTATRERIALGPEVEVSKRRGGGGEANTGGLQRRTPSLEDVLRSVRGQSSAGVPTEHTGHARHPTPAAPTSATPTLLERSVSDTTLAIPVYQVGDLATTPVKAPVGDKPLQVTVHRAIAFEKATVSSPTSTLEATFAENMVFHPVPRAPHPRLTPHPGFIPLRSAMAQSGENMQLMSPEDPGSCCSSPADSLHSDTDSSTTLHDSLNDGDPHLPLTARTVLSSNATRGSSIAGKRTPSNRRKSTDREPASHQDSQYQDRQPCASGTTPKPYIQDGLHRTNVTKSSPTSNLPNYDSDSSSSSESSYRAHYLQRYRTPPRSRRQARQPSRERGLGLKDTTSTQRHQQPTIRGMDGGAGVLEAAKIVGILKKPGSGSQSSKASSAASTACQSEAVSADGSVVTEDLLNGSLAEGAKGSKRVRFVDQMVKHPVPTVVDMSTRTQLWNRVFSNRFSPHLPPNGAFTPKMKVSLNSNGVHRKTSTPPSPVCSPPNGLVVHIPQATDITPYSHTTLGPHSSVTGDHGLPGAEGYPEDSSNGRQEMPLEPVAPASQSPPSDGTKELSAVDSNTVGTEYETGVAAGDRTTSDGRQIYLDRTPTDDDINELWHEIKTYFNGKERVMVPAQVYKFFPEKAGFSREPSREDQRGFITVPARQPPQLSRRHHIQKHQAVHGHTSPASPHGHLDVGRSKQLVHRQQNRPRRCQNELHHTSQPLQQKEGAKQGCLPSHTHQRQQAYGHERDQRRGEATTTQPHPHYRSYPGAQASSGEPGVTVTTGGGGRTGRTAPATGLSVEEQRLMDSIAKLNLRLRNHLIRQDKDPRSPSSSSSSPESLNGKPLPPPSNHHPSHMHHPRNARSRGLSDLPKTRVRRNPKSIAFAATVSARAKDSRTQLSIPLHRQAFYNP